MIEKAYAKVNLALNIIGERADKYHDIESVMVPIELHDSLEVEIVTNKRQEDDYIVCDDYKIGVAKYNLCHKAIDIAREEWKFKEHFNVRIHKNIFLQSGLGGGSADAAAVIRAIITLTKLKPSKESIIKVCKKIGADVPFMYYNKPAYVTGVGEEIKHFNWCGKFKDYYIVLVKPEEGLSTPDVYAKYDALKEHENPNISIFLEKLKNGADDAFSYQGNSLELPAFEIMPKVKEIKKDLLERGFEIAFMTGAGSCVVGLTDNRKLAKKTFKEFYLTPGLESEITTFLKK